MTDIDLTIDNETACDNYNISEINDLIESSPQNFTIFHHNIRSFSKNIDELSATLDQINVNGVIDIIVLSETWFTEESCTELESYSGFHVHRKDRRGGGLSVYVHNQYKCEALLDLTILNDIAEICTVKITINNTELIIMGTYRPPISANIPDFTAIINNFMSNFSTTQYVLLVGDLNMDLLAPNNDESDFIVSCYGNSLLPLISKPTRVSHHSQTCIDHFWFNQLITVTSGVLQVPITDHYITFCLIPLKQNTQNKFLKRFRDHKPDNIEQLILYAENFFPNYILPDNMNLDEKVQSFQNKFLETYNTFCPIRSKHIPYKKLSKPWIDKNLIECINMKHRFYREYRNGTKSHHAYHVLKKMVDKKLVKKKHKYFYNKFSNCFGDQKKTWQNINNMIRIKYKNNSIQEISVNDEPIKVPQDIADSFNNYFTNVAVELDRNIPPPTISPLQYMEAQNLDSFEAQLTNEQEVEETIMNLKNKSGNINSIPTFLYKKLKSSISTIVTNLFNESINSGIFPSILKHARITPLHKKGKKSLVNNYRPISTLSILSKVFEKLMRKRLLSFLDANGIIHNKQFGFKSNCSTSDAILEFLHHVYNTLTEQKIFITIFLDFAKAFDTVNHEILLKKLEHLGVRGVANSWFRSYLTDRKQCVVIGDTPSSLCDITCGVPQGSVLGPLLFLIYINDMINCSSRLDLIHFADDTTLYISGVSINDLTSIINEELEIINQWLIANRLSLNIDKTVYMIFTFKKIDLRAVNIQISNKQITPVESAKFLGVEIDSKLNFSPHVVNVSKSISRTIGSLNKLSYFIPKNIRMTLYHSLIYSKLSYAVVAWGRSNNCNSNKLKKLFEKSCKFINDDLLISSLLNSESIDKYFTAIKVFKTTKLEQHPFFNTHFERLIPNHNYPTRHADNMKYNTPDMRLSKCFNSFIYKGVKIWNELPIEIRNLPTLSVFKRRLKFYLLEIQEN